METPAGFSPGYIYDLHFLPQSLPKLLIITSSIDRFLYQEHKLTHSTKSSAIKIPNKSKPPDIWNCELHEDITTSKKLHRIMVATKHDARVSISRRDPDRLDTRPSPLQSFERQERRPHCMENIRRNKGRGERGTERRCQVGRDGRRRHVVFHGKYSGCRFAIR